MLGTMTLPTMALSRDNMIIIDNTDRQLEVSERNWILVEGIHLKGILDQDDKTTMVSNLDEITPELSAWGVPWKWI